MRNTKSITFTGMAMSCLFVVGMLTGTVFAQGRGGRGGSAPRGGPPAGVGVDRGLGTASGRSDGRSDSGLDRARAARDNDQQADRELRDHPGIANHLGVNPNNLRSGYQTALATNPDLKFGQFVAANVLAKNLGARNPNITTAAILNGLADGNSIGGTLQDLGLSSSEAKEAEKNAQRQIKESKGRS